VFDQVGECLGTLIKTFKASFLPFFDELSVYITPMLVSQWNPAFNCVFGFDLFLHIQVPC
jgi:hypothetical protein